MGSTPTITGQTQMKTIIGDILNIPSGMICHQVNCRRTAGTGLALHMRTRWPEWYAHYRGIPAILGEISLFCAQATPIIWVVNLYAQQNEGTGQRQTDYLAFRACLKRVSQFARDPRNPALPIYLPYRIGCGPVGGEWSVISTIIEDELPQAILAIRPASRRQES
jgi:O-acetyl-ADP-ribose deacetylase (regulator of RNase III)